MVLYSSTVRGWPSQEQCKCSHCTTSFLCSSLRFGSPVLCRQLKHDGSIELAPATGRWQRWPGAGFAQNSHLPPTYPKEQGQLLCSLNNQTRRLGTAVASVSNSSIPFLSGTLEGEQLLAASAMRSLPPFHRRLNYGLASCQPTVNTGARSAAAAGFTHGAAAPRAPLPVPSCPPGPARGAGMQNPAFPHAASSDGSCPLRGRGALGRGVFQRPNAVFESFSISFVSVLPLLNVHGGCGFLLANRRQRATVLII